MNLGNSEAYYVAGDARNRVQLVNAGGGTAYYKSTPDVSAASNDGAIASGEETVINHGVYLISASFSNVAVTPVPECSNVERVVGEPGEVAFAFYEGNVHTVGEEGEPALENEWEGTAEYRGLANKFVFVFVDVSQEEESAAPVFTLPEGFRPTAKITTAALVLETDGKVSPASSTAKISVAEAEGASEFAEPSYVSVEDAPASYTEVPGAVYLSGAAMATTEAASEDAVEVFSLPVGARPSQTVVYPGFNGPGEAPRIIEPTGAVRVEATESKGIYSEAAAKYATLDGLSFPVD